LDFYRASLGAIVQLRDFPGAETIPTKIQTGSGSHILMTELSAVTSEEGDSGFPSSLSWLYCVTLAIALYCLAIIGVLHKGLDKEDCLRIPKVTLNNNIFNVFLQKKIFFFTLFFSLASSNFIEVHNWNDLFITSIK
jgi:hypothetical protein